MKAYNRYLRSIIKDKSPLTFPQKEVLRTLEWTEYKAARTQELGQQASIASQVADHINYVVTVGIDQNPAARY
jgi:hypothetical protein